MDIFELHAEIIRDYRSYIESFINIRDGGRIYTGGGELELGLPGTSSNGLRLEGAWEILARGDIDTRAMTEWQRTPDDPETGVDEYESAIDWFEGQNEADVVDASRRGGNVVMQTVFAPDTEAPGTGITFDGSGNNGATVKTQGGLFGNARDEDTGVIILNEGRFDIVDYTIDTRRSAELEDGQGLSSI